MRVWNVYDQCVKTLIRTLPSKQISANDYVKNRCITHVSELVSALKKSDLCILV